MATDWRKSTEEFKAAMAGAAAAPETETGRKQKASREDKAMDRRAAENDARRDDSLTGRDYVAAYSRKYRLSSGA